MLLPGYSLRRGTGLDRALLVKFMQRTYQELYPEGNLTHLAHTVEQYFSSETPLWWVEMESELAFPQETAAPMPSLASASSLPTAPIGCLWLGFAIDQITGWQHPHIFLLYVSPDHRRQGIGSALMHHVEAWAKAKGSRQIGLQVFQQNQPALQLYEKLGYQPQSVWMVKSLE